MTTTTPTLQEHDADIAGVALDLARRFERGATMWCVSPSWPHHARHVAVEFVHPVMVGKRALPALALPPTGVVETLRAFGRPGDVVVAVARGDDPQVQEMARRAPAWGVRTVWIGNGARPEAGSADHLLWVDDPLAAVNGQFILLYHLLWELTHVCFEHAGALKVDPDCADDDVCVTCADDGRLAEVISANPSGHTATVRLDGEVTTVDTTLVEPVGPDDLLLVHAGSAIQTLTASEKQP